MGILIDTGVFIALQRDPKSVDFSRWAHLGEESVVSVITISELLVGAWRADNETRKQERLRFAEFVLDNHTLVNVTLEIARLHSQIVASLQDAEPQSDCTIFGSPLRQSTSIYR